MSTFTVMLEVLFSDGRTYRTVYEVQRPELGAQDVEDAESFLSYGMKRWWAEAEANKK